MYDFSKFYGKKLKNTAMYTTLLSLMPEFGQLKGYERMVANMAECGSFLEFHQCATMQESHDFTLQRANFCRSRFCPICEWRRGLKNAFKVFTLFEHFLSLNPDHEVFFLTLTLRNVERPEDVQLDRLTKLFHDLRRLNLWKDRGIIGGFWSIEITHSADKGYHPHMHILLVAPPIHRSGWLFDVHDLSDAWLQKTKDSFVVDIRATYGDSKIKSVVELCKYPTVALDGDLHAMARLYPIIGSKRMFGSFGDFRGYKDDDDLIHVNDTRHGSACSVCGSGLLKVRYHFLSSTQEYVQRLIGTVEMDEVDELVSAVAAVSTGQF